MRNPLDSLQHINDSLQIAVYKTETDKLIAKVNELQTSTGNILTAIYFIVGTILTVLTATQLWDRWQRRKLEKEEIKRAVDEVVNEANTKLLNATPIELIQSVKSSANKISSIEDIISEIQLNLYSVGRNKGLVVEETATEFESKFLFLKLAVDYMKRWDFREQYVERAINELIAHCNRITNKEELITLRKLEVTMYLEQSEFDTFNEKRNVLIKLINEKIID